MSEQRLIIPRKPHHHRRRFMTGVTVAVIAVVGVWGLQMKMTFDRYAAERNAQATHDAFAQLKEGITPQETANNLEDEMSGLKDFINTIVLQQQAQTELEAKVTEGLQTQIQAGTVAGETTEVPAN